MMNAGKAYNGAEIWYNRGTRKPRQEWYSSEAWHLNKPVLEAIKMHTKNTTDRKPCKHCGEMFTVIPRDRTVFCSAQCYTDYRQTGGRHFLCACGCGEYVYRAPYWVKHRKAGRFYVNHQHRLQHEWGESHPSWRGGSCDYGPAWSMVSAQIRERDKVCRECGMSPEQNGRALDVHHIVPYRISLNHDPDNLIALCITCHRKQLIVEQVAYPPKLPRECMYCGSEFYQKHSSQRMCSDECRAENRRFNARKRSKTPYQMERARINQQRLRDRRKAERLEREAAE